MKKVIVMFTFLLVIMGNVCAIKPMDYLLVYKYTFNQNGETNKLIAKIYCQGSQKFRMEDEISAPGQTNGVEFARKKFSVSIMRLDKKVNWLLDLENKTCKEQPIAQNSNKIPSQNLRSKLVKIGEDKVLNYDCDVCISSGQYPSKYWFSKDYDLILKTESGVEGNKVICEAIELHFEKQEDSLFEIPQDYEVIKLKVTSQEELDKQPPVTLINVERSLFFDMQAVKLSLSMKDNFRDLTGNEIDVLRQSIVSGSDLTEVSNKEIAEVFGNYDNPVFILEWSGKEMCNFWYDKADGYIYVNKWDVFHKERKEHDMDFRWLKKYAKGAYRFKPSEDLRELIK